jgi:hypothetical protein
MMYRMNCGNRRDNEKAGKMPPDENDGTDNPNGSWAQITKKAPETGPPGSRMGLTTRPGGLADFHETDRDLNGTAKGRTTLVSTWGTSDSGTKIFMPDQTSSALAR